MKRESGEKPELYPQL